MCCLCGGYKKCDHRLLRGTAEKTTEGRGGEGQKRQREFSKIPLKIN